MKPMVFDKTKASAKPVYNLGDPVDGMYVVRQGKLDELHPLYVVDDERNLSFCRHYR
jgi:hypothetical protein